MSLKPYFFILFIIFISSASSATLLLFYLNPELDTKVAFSLMAFALFLAGSSILAMVLFFLKKIYYRGEVTLSTMSASIRQGILIVIGIIMTALLFALRIAENQLIAMVWAAIACFEIMVQAIE
jgi:hypothetical protein